MNKETNKSILDIWKSIDDAFDEITNLVPEDDTELLLQWLIVINSLKVFCQMMSERS